MSKTSHFYTHGMVIPEPDEEEKRRIEARDNLTQRVYSLENEYSAGHNQTHDFSKNPLGYIAEKISIAYRSLIAGGRIEFAERQLLEARSKLNGLDKTIQRSMPELLKDQLKRDGVNYDGIEMISKYGFNPEKLEKNYHPQEAEKLRTSIRKIQERVFINKRELGDLVDAIIDSDIPRLKKNKLSFT